MATGWTIIGWIAALVWAVNKDIRNDVSGIATAAPDSMLEPRWNEIAIAAQAESAGDLKKCTYCAEHIKAEAVVCRYCGRDLVLPGAQSLQTRPTTDLDTQERRRLESLLSGEEEDKESKDPRLLDVFEYVRLLEENDPPLATNVVPIAGAETEDGSSDESGGNIDPTSDGDWDYPETATNNNRR